MQGWIAEEAAWRALAEVPDDEALADAVVACRRVRAVPVRAREGASAEAKAGRDREMALAREAADAHALVVGAVRRLARTQILDWEIVDEARPGTTGRAVVEVETEEPSARQSRSDTLRW